jgi:hypothetical protein
MLTRKLRRLLAVAPIASTPDAASAPIHFGTIRGEVRADVRVQKFRPYHHQRALGGPCETTAACNFPTPSAATDRRRRAIARRGPCEVAVVSVQAISSSGPYAGGGADAIGPGWPHFRRLILADMASEVVWLPNLVGPSSTSWASFESSLVDFKPVQLFLSVERCREAIPTGPFALAMVRPTTAWPDRGQGSYKMAQEFQGDSGRIRHCNQRGHIPLSRGSGALSKRH